MYVLQDHLVLRHFLVRHMFLVIYFELLEYHAIPSGLP